jgi:hypothetical protein
VCHFLQRHQQNQEEAFCQPLDWLVKSDPSGLIDGLSWWNGRPRISSSTKRQ